MAWRRMNELRYTTLSGLLYVWLLNELNRMEVEWPDAFRVNQLSCVETEWPDLFG